MGRTLKYYLIIMYFSLPPVQQVTSFFKLLETISEVYLTEHFSFFCQFLSKIFPKELELKMWSSYLVEVVHLKVLPILKPDVQDIFGFL